MFFSNDFSDRVEIYTPVVTATDLNPDSVYSNLQTTRWAAVVQLRPEADQKVNYLQSWDAQRNYKITFRGKHDYDIGNVRFKWRKTGYIFEAISCEFLPSRMGQTVSQYTCRRVDNVEKSEV